MERYNNENYKQVNQSININGNLNHTVDSGFVGKVALILSILSLLCCCIDWLFSIPAIICAIVALIKNNRDACAWAAIIISVISLGIYALAIMTGMMDDVESSVKEKTGIESSIKDDNIDNSSDKNNTDSSVQTDDSEIKSDTNNTKGKSSNQERKTYHIGDEILVETDEGSYSLCITGITETSDRNQFSDKQADRVVIIDYQYENISHDTQFGDYYNDELYISDIDFSMYDADGNAMETYPTDIKYPQAVSIGHKSSGQMAYALNNDKNYIEAEYHDNMFMGSDFTIILEW